MLSYSPIDLVLIAITLIGLPASSAWSGRKIARTPRHELNMVRRYWFIIVKALFVSSLILLTWHWLGRPYSALGFRIGIWGGVGFGVDALLLCLLIYDSLLRKLPVEKLAGLQQRMEKLRLIPQTRAELAVFPLVAVVASVAEELIYRGYLLWALTPVAGPWPAVAISSVSFGVGHAYQGWVGVLRTSLIGLTFAAAFVLTHSLWWLMVAHVMLNLSANLVALRFRRLSAAPTG